MDHGRGFMLLLKDVFTFATSNGLFGVVGMSSEIQSHWPWENAIVRTGGSVCADDLIQMHDDALLLERALSREVQQATEDANRQSCSSNEVEDHCRSRDVQSRIHTVVKQWLADDDDQDLRPAQDDDAVSVE